MSRIYEALQKAESERLQERGEREPESREQSIDPAAQSRVAAALAQYSAVAAEPLASVIDVPAAPVANRSGIDLGRIERRPWALSLSQLPALQERGPSVEQFRSLRSRIFELRDIKPLKSILVSSGLDRKSVV